MAIGRKLSAMTSSVGGELERLGLDLHLAGLDLREVEDVVDQTEQVLGVVIDAPEAVGLGVGERSLSASEHGVGEAEDDRQGGAELVAHVREELALELGGDPQLAVLPLDLGLLIGQAVVGRLELDGLAAEGLVREGVADGGAEMAGDDPQEVLGAVVERLGGGEGEHADEVRAGRQGDVGEFGGPTLADPVVDRERGLIAFGRSVVGDPGLGDAAEDALPGVDGLVGHACSSADRNEGAEHLVLRRADPDRTGRTVRGLHHLLEGLVEQGAADHSTRRGPERPGGRRPGHPDSPGRGSSAGARRPWS